MKKLGRVLFYLLWPFVWFYAPLRIRVRAIILVKGKILLVKNWFGPAYWQLPGGGLELTEQPVDAIIREIKEELSIIIKPTQVKHLTQGPIIINKKGLLYRYRIVLIKLKSFPEISMSRELTQYKWEPINSTSLPSELAHINTSL